MKWYWLRAIVLANGLLFSIAVFAASTSANILQQMRHAALTLDYEFAFINATRGNIESLRYRHAVINDQSLAQLLQLDGAIREVLMRGSEISYFFEQGVAPFSISGDHIIDAMPAVVFADFNRLERYYDFIPVGRSRVANRLCEVIRVVAKDGYRYSYIIWIDGETKLPLQIELLDRNSETLEQFRVISLITGEEVRKSIAGLLYLQLPPLLPQIASDSVSFRWSNSWLPEGFAEISSSHRKLANVTPEIETRLFSDGLFSFSVNVMPFENGNQSQYMHEGRRTIYTEVRSGHEIVIVGEIPQSTAKRIAGGITFANVR